MSFATSFTAIHVDQKLIAVFQLLWCQAKIETGKKVPLPGSLLADQKWTQILSKVAGSEAGPLWEKFCLPKVVWSIFGRLN